MVDTGWRHHRRIPRAWHLRPNLYINQAQGVLIVAAVADLSFRETRIDASNVDMFRQIAQTL
jgi:hypothetical protein